MAPTWVLEKEIFPKKTFDLMVAYFRQHGIAYHAVEIKSHTHEIVGKIPEISGPVVIYGSIGSRDLMTHYGWTPGAWTNEQFNELILNDRLGVDYLNHGIVSTLFKNVLDHVGDDPFFVKPDTDTKEFAGKVFFSKEAFTEWYMKQVTTGYFDEHIYETRVVVGAPKHIGTEWRIVMVRGEPITGSIYRQYQQVYSKEDLPHHVSQFARYIAAKHSPCDVFVMDICETFHGLKVVEYNSFNCAGLYACNIEKIIEAVTNYVDNSTKSY